MGSTYLDDCKSRGKAFYPTAAREGTALLRHVALRIGSHSFGGGGGNE